MRYYFTPDSLIVRGNFRAASNGIDGGIKDVRTLLNISIPRGFTENAKCYINRISNQNGFLQPQFGLLTAVPIHNMCICQYDEITVFVTAAISDSNRTVNIIVTSEKTLSDAALLGAVMTVTEAKMKVLIDRKLPPNALSTDAVIVASEKNSRFVEEFAGPLTVIGEKISRSVSYALNEALVRFDNYLLVNWGVTRGWSNGSVSMRRKRPSFFIYSRYGGDHWNEWLPDGCPYHPCHKFAEQQCDFCYCPLYPCKDSEFSEQIDTPRGKVWSCMDCRFIHEPAVVSHLKANPEASVAELKAVRRI